MRLFKNKPNYDFIGHRFKFFFISGILVGGSALLLATRGLNWGIDFTGGSIVQIKFEQEQNLETLRSDIAKAGYPEAILQRFTRTNSYTIRIKGDTAQFSETVDEFLTAFRKTRPGTEFVVEQKEFVGPTVGRHLYKQALFAVIFSLLGVVSYVAFRFANPLWGLAGILALGHDVIVTLGLFSLLQMELNLILVAAILTIAGYSINDTIVIFDRLREKLRSMRRSPPEEVLNLGINETLSRTMITSLTTFFTVLTLFLLGGTVIHDFALTLCVGVLVGTYSSIAIAAPSVYQWEQRRARKSGGGSPLPSPPVGQDQPSGRRARRARRRENP